MGMAIAAHYDRKLSYTEPPAPDSKIVAPKTPLLSLAPKSNQILADEKCYYLISLALNGKVMGTII